MFDRQPTRDIAVNTSETGFPSRGTEILRNAVAGLTVSFVAISLGAAFGILSGRGAFVGMLSAGLFAFVAALLGGTRVQCSGPTAPMTAVTATVVGYAQAGLAEALPGANQAQFINLVIILTGVVMLLMALLRLGRFIEMVPRVVVSGFMNGIAILIWIDQARKLMGFGGAHRFAGSVALNLGIACVTFLLVMRLSRWLAVVLPGVAKYVPGTLLTIVLVTAAASLLRLDVERVSLDLPIDSLAALGGFVSSQIPRDWSLPVLLAATGFAVQLAMLGYLDTLLTSLVIDKLSGEKTRQDRELAAQGVANAAVGLVGGIPGAQATIRSVLILKEGATLRLAGVLVGVFVVVELILLRGLITLIPQAVFSGLLFKVGYDVFDWLPVRLYVKELSSDAATLMHRFFGAHPEESVYVTNVEMFFIVGTTLVTVFWNLNVAVIGFGALFLVVKRWVPMRDLEPETETLVASETAELPVVIL